ncbi:MAG: DUF4920 domain-containing protein [Flavobacteriaceae bacterium]|nr:DUF4920 domain-containing protein [Flavobacteriaceae bacterium]
MKKIVLLMFVLAVIFSCKEKTDQNLDVAENADVIEVQTAYASYGEEITDKDVVTKDVMIEKYKTMKVGDTVDIKFSSEVNSVCQSKGCWMRLNLGDNESFVKFKDYGFFMPKDIAGQEVIVAGKAFVEETSVDDLKHFAEDAGKTQEEIDAITEPELSYSFLSHGVLIPEKQ